MVVAVPPVVERLLTADVAVEIAEVFTDNVIYPDRIVVDGPASGRLGLGRSVQVLLWSQHGQCDWWISAAAEDSLRTFAAGLLELPGLRDTLWSNDDAGTRLLDESRR